MMRRQMKISKYKAKKRELDGEVFDSQKEMRRWLKLKEMEAAGEIKNLTRQVEFTLVPSQRDEDGKVIERAVKYRADFMYVEDGRTIVEDCKGYKTDTYIIKRKLMLYIHGVRIKET
jgi:hypothetical protein